jgi:hypothetical protein
MIYRILTLWAPLVWATAWAQNLKPLNDAKTVLQGVKKHYEQAGQKDPKNKVAKNIADELKNAVVAIEAYAAGKKTKKDLTKTLDKAEAETKKSNQPEAQKAQKALASAKASLAGLPEVVKKTESKPAENKPAAAKPAENKTAAAKPAENKTAAENKPAENKTAEITAEEVPGGETTAPDEALTGTADAEDLETEASPTVAVGPQPAPKTAGNFALYVLIALNFVALVVVAYLIMGAVKKLHAGLEARLSKTEAAVDGMQFSAPGLGQEVKIGQFENRVAALESNAIAFMERLEERIAHIENRVRELNAPNEPVRPDEQAPIHVPEEVNKQLIAALEDLREQAPPDIMTDVDAAIEQLRTDAPDVKRLALLLQYAYVRSFYQLDDGGYNKLYEALKNLGFSSDDKMQGRMAFSDFYARNVGIKNYPTAREFHTPYFPPPEVAQKAAKETAARPEALPKTVLFTLKPTVRLQRGGAKIVLAKGAYIIND